MTRLKLEYVHEFTDRHGRVRRYFRRHGKRTPLPGLPGSAEFMEAYQAALADLPPPMTNIGASKTKPGTVNAAIVGYYQSLAFRELAALTQANRRAILERFRAEHGDKRIATLPKDFIVRTLSKRKSFAARNLLKTLRGLLTFAVAEGFRHDNPTDGLKLPAPKSAGIHTWSEIEIEQFESVHPIGSRPRLAFALLLYTAQRRGDVIRMGRQHVRNNAVHVRQSKTGAELEIPVHAELARIIASTPGDHLTFLTNDRGQPFSSPVFGNLFRKWCDAAGLPQCSGHGLRKAACRRLAEAGCTVHQIAAISGHASLSEVQRYTKAADQARLAREAMRTMQQADSKGESRTAGGKPDR